MTLQVLRPCTEMWGAYEMRAADPKVSQLSGAVYLPQLRDKSWGIYDRDGRIFAPAVDLHGPGGETHNQCDTVTLPAHDDIKLAPEKYYIYGGELNPHFGHFIVNTLPRLWQSARMLDRSAKILFHGVGQPCNWLDRPFIRDIFNALSIGPENMRIFSAPTLLPDVVIPHASLQEQHFAHRILGSLGAKIGSALLGAEPVLANTRPVYLSKTALPAGVGRVTNEGVVEDILRQRGIDVVHPETLTMREQVRLFAERTCILGIVGSAFHTGLFHPPQGRVICISPTPGPNSNFYLLDGAAGYQVEYYFAPGSRIAGRDVGGFLTSMEFAQPDMIANDLLTLIDAAPSSSKALLV